MELISTVFYFIIVIGILVLVHEFGHFIAARLTGIRAEVFSIGMGYRLLGFNKKSGFSFGSLPKDFDGEGNTDYRLSLFPVGGYVKVAGMVDESMDTDFTNREPQSWEFRSKGFFAKAFVMSGGVLMNIILAFVLLTAMVYNNGTEVNASTRVGYVQAKSLAELIGFKVGDRLVSVNDKKIDNWQHFIEMLSLENLGRTRNIIVLRNGEKRSLSVGEKELIKLTESENNFGLESDYLQNIVGNVKRLYPAEKFLKPGDTLLSINTIPVRSGYEVIDQIKKANGKTLLMDYKRGSDVHSDSITPAADGFIGVEFALGKVIHQNYSLIESVVYGGRQLSKSVKLFFGLFSQIFSGERSFGKSVAGPIGIAMIAYEQAGRGLWDFLNFMALMSISLALINILPFPALDGGHLAIIIIEGITRKELSVKAKLITQQAGLVILLLLMAFVFYKEILKYFF
ncbi:MAG: regulator of sigma protease [Bacteroidota bacterium]|nr:regulator of sigma protease [Bacteroidota bacterium]